MASELPLSRRETPPRRAAARRGGPSKQRAIGEESLGFNGVDRGGNPLFAPLSLRELGRLALGNAPESLELRQARASKDTFAARSLGPKQGVDARVLAEAGWGVIFARGADPALREALAPLLAHRSRQAGRVSARRYREMAGARGYRPGESKQHFLARNGAGPGPADPDRMPYYLLLVGDPETIPFSFQYQLDVQYAVGRISFDTLEEYARYAEAVVAAEEGAVPRPRRAVFFGVRNDGDRATELSCDQLVQPLARKLAREVPGWEIRSACRQEATRERLGRLLGGEETPSLLFTASHGLGFDAGHPLQRAEQGALVCQQSGAGSPYFTAADVAGDACPGGLIVFSFACFGAGTPRDNGFAHRGAGEPAEVSDGAFVARLPQRLLGHPRGGALAMVGHVDRTWSWSFSWPGAGRQIEVFASTLRRLLAGHPLGSAMEFFNQRYAELQCDLADLREQAALGGVPDLQDVAGIWTACNDARSFVVLGDPAVRLPQADGHGREASG